MSTPSRWNWRVSGVNLPPPNSRTLNPLTPRAYDELGFDPTSAYDLRHHLGVCTDEPGRFMASIDKFLASDIAWLASGASNDDQHQIEDRFFDELDHLRQATLTGNAGATDRKAFIEQGRRLIYDLATKIDRAIGSTTMVLTMEGTTIPGTPACPEYLKAHVHLPPSFLTHNLSSKHQIATIVQLFIEHIGVPTIATWERRARKLWSLPVGSANVTRALNKYTPLIPTLSPSTSTHYLFRGREAGWRPLAPDAAVAPMLSQGSTIYDIDDIPMDPVTSDLVSAYERIANLETDLRAADAQIINADHQIETLQGVASGYEESQAELRMQLRDLCYFPAVHSFQIACGAFHPESSAPHDISYNNPSCPFHTSALLRIWLHPEHSVWPKHIAWTSGFYPFLIDEELELHTDAIRLICRFVGPLRWSSEIESLQYFPPGAMGSLLVALERDLAA
ncbi:hypothetical protein MVEN_01877400 [Mycena venus]|uniref:Uncharacterized protein n=1 Tax=Mycena venus TaxID=2733690 RepID=A0A8H6XJ11_9AGAR|nr:hypothetical protein MVEN_01877400 [Mycena venus]